MKLYKNWGVWVGFIDMVIIADFGGLVIIGEAEL